MKRPLGNPIIIGKTSATEWELCATVRRHPARIAEVDSDRGAPSECSFEVIARHPSA
jgi:hypothetical protein